MLKFLCHSVVDFYVAYFSTVIGVQYLPV